MSATWDHPKLGRFEYRSQGWTRAIGVPAFEAFAFEAARGDARRSKGKYDLVFTARDEGEKPSAAAAAMADAILANQAALVGVVARALWDDVNGRGAGAGKGYLPDVKRAFKIKKLAGPARAEDLLPALRVSGILVLEDVPNCSGPVAELDFDAAFDPEHGVGVLTDGRTVLGIGQVLDVTPSGFTPPPSPFG